MDGAADLLSLLPEVQEALSEEFDGIECSISAGPVLTQSPFRLGFGHLGRQVTYVPDLSCLEEFDSSSLHQLSLSPRSALFTDGLSGCCLELALGRGRDWKTPLTKLFDRLYPNKWAFFVAELEQSQPTYHVLCCNTPPVSSCKREDTPDSTELSSQVSSPAESVSDGPCFSLWIVPVTRIFAIPPIRKPVKVVKKVVKKKSPMEGETTTTTKTIVGEDGKEKKVRVVKRVVKKERTGETPEREVATPDSALNRSTTLSSGSITNGGSSSSIVQNGSNGNLHSNGVSHSASTSSQKEEDDLVELRKKLLGSESTSRADAQSLLNGDRKTNGQLRHSLSRKSMTPDKRPLDPIYEGLGRKERSISPVKVHTQSVVCRVNGVATNGLHNPNEIPVVALQLVLGNCFTYAQLGKLRAVHPYWDEICGQLLNSGYYQLLERSDKLLMALQRKLPADASLHYPTTILTNIQVHILNPVDIMRAVLDEGVCCFPYGAVLDRVFLLLDQIEFMLNGGDQLTVNWEPVATIAKRAQLHYRTKLEKIMEDRLGENLRLKAAQRIIRLDSFMVESSVTKLEKDSAKARDDFKWELEQLQQQNAQLRKDNRTLRQDYMKMETRVEILEQKFKTLARLLG